MAKNPQNLPAAVSLETHAESDEFGALSEFATDMMGALAPFGNVELPLPLDKINYTHPGPKDRPHLAHT
jgi:hypothetical protein